MGLLVYFLWDKIANAWDKMFQDNSDEKGEALKDKDGKNFSFNIWSVGAYKNLVNSGYSVKLWKSEFALKTAQELRDSGWLVYRDNEIMSAIRKAGFKTQINQLATLFSETYIPIVKPEKDLYQFLKDKLSDENFNSIINFISNLPKGYEKTS